MNRKETRQYEMLLRVRDFGDTHGTLFSESTLAQQTFESVAKAVDELTATDMRRMSASMSARADRKTAAREALVDLLMRVSQLAKVLRVRGSDVALFEFPGSRSDQALLTAGRQFAADAAAFEADFRGHGMGSAHISAVTTAFEEALRDRGMSRAEHTASRTRIRELISNALLDVRRLDLMIGNELGDHNVIQAVWKQARRVADTRAPRADAVGEPARAVEPPPSQAA